ncbi:dihydrodipicolinate synthase family protein [Salinisphaera aquimarina]|uniref:Dihydrodipicolinate synthase family protein n=1 Tax=Salinisphaera aquimarina TaxID=2094031 RepID=A0ABV7EPJ0_9GAMM
MDLFRGLSAFPITPCDAAGQVDVDALQRLLSRLVDAGVDSIGLLGSTGSYPYLTRPARGRAIEAAVEITRGRVPLLVGIGALRTDDAVRLAVDAREAGADALLLAPVSYIPLLEDEVFAHFATVAAATDLPLCVYNNPGTTGFTFSPSLLGRLSRLPNIVAAKNPSAPTEEMAARHGALADAAAAGFSLGYSVDWHANEALIAGGTTWYSVAAGLFPEPCLGIVRAVQAGEHEQARQMNLALEPLWKLFRTYSSYRVVHAAAQVVGVTDTDPPLPILPLPGNVRDEISRVLERLNLD